MEEWGGNMEEWGVTWRSGESDSYLNLKYYRNGVSVYKKSISQRMWEIQPF